MSYLDWADHPPAPPPANLKGAHMIVPPNIPPRIADHIREIIDYNWDREEADYADNSADNSADNPGDDTHVFHHLRAVREWLTTRTPTVPDLGDTFTHEGHRRVVTSWLKRHPAPLISFPDVGPDMCPLMFCPREEAEYVGVTGYIVRVADVTVTGHVSWSDETLNRHRTTMELMAGCEVT